jgi:lipid-binding SYLF domain-containing protein
MKNTFKLFLVSTLLITSGTLFAESLFDTSDVRADQQVADEETVFTRDDDKIIINANKTLTRSVMAIDKIMNDPENSIPQSIISKSEGIIIFPGAFKIALGVAGGQGGRGIAMIRKEDGSWSNPFFVSLGEGSVGIQIGAQSSDIFLLFKDKNDIMDIEEAEVTLGSEISVAAGPSSKGSSTITDFEFESEIYSYQSSKGLFAGVSLKGGVLTYNNRYNDSLYSMDDINMDAVLNGFYTPYNDKVNDLIQALNMYGE